MENQTYPCIFFLKRALRLCLCMYGSLGIIVVICLDCYIAVLEL